MSSTFLSPFYSRVQGGWYNALHGIDKETEAEERQGTLPGPHTNWQRKEPGTKTWTVTFPLCSFNKVSVLSRRMWAGRSCECLRLPALESLLFEKNESLACSECFAELVNTPRALWLWTCSLLFLHLDRLIWKMGIIMAPTCRFFRKVPGMFLCPIVISLSPPAPAVKPTTIDLLLCTTFSHMEIETAWEGWTRCWSSVEEEG